MVYLNGGSNHLSSSFKVKLPSGAVVYTCDVTWAHPREPFKLPEAAGGGGIGDHLLPGIGINAAAAAAAAAAAFAYNIDAAATTAATAVYAVASVVATAMTVWSYSPAG